GVVLRRRKPRASRARQEHDLPHLSQPLPGQRRRDEAVRALREVPGARLSGEARPEPSPRDSAQPSTLKAAARAAVAAGRPGYSRGPSPPGRGLAARAGPAWLPTAVGVALVRVDPALRASRWLHLLSIIAPAARPPLVEIMRIFFVSTFVGTFLPASI